jgi:hypothetical protein
VITTPPGTLLNTRRHMGDGEFDHAVASFDLKLGRPADSELVLGSSPPRRRQTGCANSGSIPEPARSWAVGGSPPPDAEPHLQSQDAAGWTLSSPAAAASRRAMADVRNPVLVGESVRADLVTRLNTPCHRPRARTPHRQRADRQLVCRGTRDLRRDRRPGRRRQPAAAIPPRGDLTNKTSQESVHPHPKGRVSAR